MLSQKIYSLRPFLSKKYALELFWSEIRTNLHILKSKTLIEDFFSCLVKLFNDNSTQLTDCKYHISRVQFDPLFEFYGSSDPDSVDDFISCQIAVAIFKQKTPLIKSILFANRWRCNALSSWYFKFQSGLCLFADSS